MKRTILILTLLGIVLGFVLSGCSPSETERYIQGTWAFANEQGDPRSTELHVLNEWWFGGGRYFYQFEVAFGFPLVSEGRYRIVETEEDRIVIELYFVEGNAPLFENQQVYLNLERDTDSLRINRTLYDRAGP